MGEKLKWFKKVASVIARIKYRSVPPELLYFYRDTYVCKMVQSCYFFKDYLLKRPYKRIEFRGEFGAEMQFSLPHAYWHFCNGTLQETISFPGTKDFYFFSKNHVEVAGERTNEGNYNFDLPRVLYSQDYNMKKWKQVPLKEFYQNAEYRYDKPILIIANRYNSEWDGPPVSFFSINVLDEIIRMLKDKYTIVYNRPQASQIVNDNSTIYDLDEFQWLTTNYPEVLIMQDLFHENKINATSFNHFQLCVYANCSNFMSIHGGTSVLASYFGGKNLILSKKGPEHYFNCFQKLYPQLSNAEICHARNDEEVLKYAKTLFEI